jgi:hypothetical protein
MWKTRRVLLLSAVPLFHFPEHRVGDETAAIDLEPKALGRPTSGAVDGNPLASRLPAVTFG